ncbi:MAG: ACP S-malonyltransferase [Catenulispora sp.]|nr:ACP S-malonyltransferase [Catenulispora sp.]
MGPANFADVGRFMLVNPVARKLVAAADARLGYPLVDRFGQTPGDYSEYAQVAFFVNCLALAEWAGREFGVEPDVAVGPSFGEKPLTAFVQTLPFEEAVWMTARLARILEEYFATEHTDLVTHSFVRTPWERLHGEVLSHWEEQGLWYDVSCRVDDDFHMITVHERNLDALSDAVRGLGGLNLYTMRPPMHSSAFGSLRRKCEDEVIGDLEFRDPKIPVLADQDGSEATDGEAVRAMLLDSFVRPVRWPDVVAGLRRAGVGRLCVAGADGMFGRVPVTRNAFEVLAVDPRLAMQPRRRGAAAP